MSRKSSQSCTTDRIRPSVAILLALIILANSQTLVDAQAQERLALVQIPINAAYDDTPESLGPLKNVIEFLPDKQVVLEPGGNLSTLIARTFGFGSSNLPKTYAVLESDILRRNGWKRPEEAKAGLIRVPLLPSWAPSRPNPRNKFNLVPKLEVFGKVRTFEAADTGDVSTSSAKIRPVSAVVTSGPRILDQNRPAANWVSQMIHIPEEYLPGFLKRYGKATQGYDYRAFIQLASSSSDNSAEPTHHVLTNEEHDFIRGVLAQNGPEIILAIADTGWPDQATYIESIQTIRHIFDTVRTYGKFSVANRPPVPAFVPPANQHCAEIAASLAEFRALDPNNRIKVVYVPLIPEQNSAGILQELLGIDFLQRQLRSNFGLDSPERLPEDIRRQAKIEADRIIRKVDPAWPQNSNQVRSDEAIISAYLNVFHRYAMITNAPIFVSESWALPSESYTVTYPDPFAGLVVAAAGNDNGADFVSLKRDFAGRSRRHKDTLAVIGLDNTGALQCKSSTVSRNLDSIMAVGFDGVVSGQVCGTSFAAPRVAWLLAFEETLTSQFDPTSWDDSVYRKLLQGRSNTTTLQQLRYDRVRILSGGTQH